VKRKQKDDIDTFAKSFQEFQQWRMTRRRMDGLDLWADRWWPDAKARKRLGKGQWEMKEEEKEKVTRCQYVLYHLPAGRTRAENRKWNKSDLSPSFPSFGLRMMKVGRNHPGYVSDYGNAIQTSSLLIIISQGQARETQQIINTLEIFFWILAIER
jgi:hypothetical protein